MRKLIGFTLMAFGFILALTYQAQSGSIPRSPKMTYISNYTTSMSSITAFTTAESTSSIYKSGAVYQVVLSSGAAGEYVILYDTTTTLGLPLGTRTCAITTKLFFSSNTAVPNTIFTFDPPIMFENGLFIIDSAVTGQAQVTYELGRGLSGN